MSLAHLVVLRACERPRTDLEHIQPTGSEVHRWCIDYAAYSWILHAVLHQQYCVRSWPVRPLVATSGSRICMHIFVCWEQFLLVML